MLPLPSNGSRGRSAFSSHGAAFALNENESSTIGVHQVCLASILCGFLLPLSLLCVMEVSVSRSHEKTRLEGSLRDGESSIQAFWTSIQPLA